LSYCDYNGYGFHLFWGLIGLMGWVSGFLFLVGE
jgi:hypothetical protein